MLRIASIPATHAYVQRVLPAVVPVDYPAVTQPPAIAWWRGTAARLPDPLPEGRRPDEGVWWPHAALEPSWVREHRDEIDVVHLHFGFEARTRDQLVEWVATLRDLDLPLVLTVHDLDNPHLLDQSPHAAALDVLVPAAAQVLTLTPGAADEIARRWGVTAQVVPHPQVVDDETLSGSDRVRASASGTHPVVGLHLGALRANADPLPWLAELDRACTDLGCTLDVIANDEVLDDERRARLEQIRAVLEGSTHSGVRTVPRMPDDQLHRWVARQEVAVLPYTHGTHSGWLEMCWDLGTSVLAPPVGHYAEQHPDPRFCAALEPGHVREALAGLLEARADGCPWGSADERHPARVAGDHDVRVAHEAAYARVTGEVSR